MRRQLDREVKNAIDRAFFIGVGTSGFSAFLGAIGLRWPYTALPVVGAVAIVLFIASRTSDNVAALQKRARDAEVEAQLAENHVRYQKRLIRSLEADLEKHAAWIRRRG